MKISSGLLLFLLCFQTTHAQDVTFDVNLEGFSSFGSVRLNDTKNSLGKPINNFEYKDVNGSAFWSDKWTPAILYTSTYSVAVAEAKLNFYTNELWFRDQAGTVLAANAGIIKKIVFYRTKDTTATAAKFLYLPAVGEGTNHFFQVLNDGPTQLFKLDNITLNKGVYDVTGGKQEYNFLDQKDYYLQHNNEVNKIRNLNKETLFSIVQPNQGDLDWLKQNGNKLRSEKDFASFLDYYNRQRQTVSKP